MWDAGAPPATRVYAMNRSMCILLIWMAGCESSPSSHNGAASPNPDKQSENGDQPTARGSNGDGRFAETVAEHESTIGAAIIVPLQPTPYCQGGTHAPITRDIFGPDPEHPDTDTIDLYFAPSLGPDHLMVGLEPRDSGWSVSVDIDSDGSIGASERFAMQLQDPQAAEARHVVAFQVPYPTDENPDYKVDITLGVTDAADGPVLETCVESGRIGTIPTAGGVAVLISGKGGDFSLPATTLIIDGDGDGTPDHADHLNHYSLREEVVRLPDGHVYTTHVDASGTTLRLRPTDRAVSGLHFMAPAPDFQGVATDGAMHRLAEYRGRLLLLDFWATWCGPCIALHPDVEAFAKEQDLTVLGISADDTLVDVQRWLKRNPTPWPSIAEGPDGPIHKAYRVNSWPTHALVDPEGRLIAYGRWDAVKKVVLETRKGGLEASKTGTGAEPAASTSGP